MNSLSDQRLTRLAPRLGLAALIFYGVGDILGAGIYALVGKVAGEAGTAVWLSFTLAAILAIVTGLSYAELAARIPRAAGAAAYCAAAFRWRFIPFYVGILVLASGVTSAATVAIAIHGYLKVIFAVPELAAALWLIAAMSLVSFLGIRETSGVNILFTCIEASGLLLVVGAGYLHVFGNGIDLFANIEPPRGEWVGVLAGASIAFYAFIGFEDLANLSEEAKNPSRDIPRAMLVSIGVCTVVYLAVLFVVMAVMTPAEAARSERPLLEVLTRSGLAFPAWAFSLIALFAIVNTGLANLVMASRLLYGMATDALLPRVLARVHQGRRTPWVAVVVAMLLCAALVISGGVKVMAQTTSLLLVLVFLFVHVGLIVIRRREGNQAVAGTLRVPWLTPYIGIVFCGLLFAQTALAAWQRAGIVSLVAIALFAVRRGRTAPNAPPPHA